MQLDNVTKSETKNETKSETKNETKYGPFGVFIVLVFMTLLFVGISFYLNLR